MQWNSIGSAVEATWRKLKQVFMPKIKSLLFYSPFFPLPFKTMIFFSIWKKLWKKRHLFETCFHLCSCASFWCSDLSGSNTNNEREIMLKLKFCSDCSELEAVMNLRTVRCCALVYEFWIEWIDLEIVVDAGSWHYNYIYCSVIFCCCRCCDSRFIAIPRQFLLRCPSHVYSLLFWYRNYKVWRSFFCFSLFAWTTTKKLFCFLILRLYK